MTLERDLTELARRMRVRILEAGYKSGVATHLGGGLSMVEILAVLYGHILNYDYGNPSWADRDRFILSKGHGVLGLFSALVECEIMSEEKFNTFMQNGSDLIAHPIENLNLGIESSNGSLGHGLSYGIGVAWAAKLKKEKFHTYVYLGDGECNEGSIWEAAMAASHLKLDNLTAIIDANGFQSDGDTHQVMNSFDLSSKFQNFGWEAQSVNGHDISLLIDCLTPRAESDYPRVLVAKTIKGKGVSFMENDNSWHHKRLTQGNFEKALLEVGGVNDSN
jgi:transketolase